MGNLSFVSICLGIHGLDIEQLTDYKFFFPLPVHKLNRYTPEKNAAFQSDSNEQNSGYDSLSQTDEKKLIPPHILLYFLHLENALHFPC